MYLDKIKSSIQKNVKDIENDHIHNKKSKKKKRAKKQSKFSVCKAEVSNKFLQLCESTIFKKGIICTIILNTLIMAIEFYQQP
jgi:hypothetical protein